VPAKIKSPREARRKVTAPKGSPSSAARTTLRREWTTLSVDEEAAQLRTQLAEARARDDHQEVRRQRARVRLLELD
jgi:hypothetical protein